ncbi:FtsX-like permease family protein [Anaerovorax odorimutans]|uniref:FtsX-like permease family protein n=1 Tax=Anaerovorax odorimutans TaxID=109327 RepID=UPI000405E7D6|nr:FtsX-like permease family protein [Anaerovorax odorimutans]
MNIMNKLTLRHLRLNKKRTIITIIGVIISVAMITGVATLSISFLDLMKRETIANTGNWHVFYNDISKRQLEAVLQNDNYKEVTVSKDLGYASLKGSKNKNKPYLFIKEFNDTGFKNFPITLKEGRLPKKEGEIVISDSVLKNTDENYKIGSVLNLQIGQRHLTSDEETILNQSYNIEWDDNGNPKEKLVLEKTMKYEIVGIVESPKWEPGWSPGYTAISYLDEKAVSESEIIDAYIVSKNINSNILTEGNEFAQKEGISEYYFNSDLLRYYGIEGNDQVKKMLQTLTIIVMVIIVFGSVSLIYNAFAISVSERSRHLGMLSSIGATRKQKRNSVFFESIVIGTISIPIGIVCGILGIGITFIFINSIMQSILALDENFKLVISPTVIISAVLISIFTILISSYIPAIRASKITPIDAIRQTSDIKLSRKSVKTSKLTRKIFGIEGEIALKNLKRNKRRYRATIFSLVISIVLFLCVSYFATGLQQAMDMSQSDINFDMMVSIRSESKNLDQITSAILNMDQVSKGADTSKFFSMSPQGSQNPSYYIYALDDIYLRDYSKEIGVNYKDLMDTEKMNAIVIQPVTYRDMGAGKVISKNIIEGVEGDKFDVYYYDNNEEEKTIGSLYMEYFTDKLPIGVQTASEGATGHLIVSKGVFNKLFLQNQNFNEEKNIQLQRQLYLNSDNTALLQENIESLTQKSVNNLKYGELYVYNVYQQKNNEDQVMLLLGIFVYGFITLITAICIANIFNTISTSVALRKREFAMLKSVGMTPKGFNKMIRYESIFYGLKALLYGIPISVLLMIILYKTYALNFTYDFSLPWNSILSVVIAVFIFISVTMLYASNKLKKESIIDGLKDENI